MNLWQNYLRPKTLAEAMDAFSSAQKPLAPIAGGTDLLLDLEQRRHSPVHTLIDVTEIEELLALEIRAGSLFIGAGVPVNSIILDPLVGAHAQALVEACELIGGPQVRNVATLGGNVAHALPAADGTIALLALDAEAEIASLLAPAAVLSERIIETHRIPFINLFLGPGKSSLKHGAELIVGFYIPVSTSKDFEIPIPESPETFRSTYRSSSCFKRIMRPQGVALPIINCAVWLERVGEDTINDICIAIGPGSGIPFRATKAERELRGRSLNETTFESALGSLLAQAQFRSSPRRAGADYRRHLIVTLFKDTLESAWKRAN